MGFFWPDSGADDSGAVRRLYQMRRRVYLGSVLLVSLVSFEAVLCGSALDVPTWFRVFNYTVCGYAIALLAYTTWWLWRSWAVSKKRRLLSMVDPLTGLMNWQGLVEVMRGHSSEADQGPVHLVYVDLMGLEKVNALHGQTTGDSVLAEAGNVLEVVVPEDCPVGRLGGDEFLVLLLEVGSDEAEEVRQRIAEEMENYDFGVGETSIKAHTVLVPDVSETRTLTDALASVRLGGGGPGTALTANPEDGACYSVPQVTLGACTRHRFDDLEASVRNEFHIWREDTSSEFLEHMGREVLELLDLRAESRDFDFVTSAPSGEASSDGQQAREQLAKKVADLLKVPYKKVLVASPISPALDYAEPRVAAPIQKGTYALLVADLVQQGTHLRRCVEKLSKAGAFVQVAGWAAKE